MGTKAAEIYQDIANAPIREGDWIVYVDHANHLKYTFEILAAFAVKGNIRTFKVRVLESTNPAVKEGTILAKWELDRREVVTGAILTPEARQRRLAEHEIPKLAAVQLRSLIDSDPDGVGPAKSGPHKGMYSVSFSVGLQFLYDSKVFPAEWPVEKGRVKLRELCKQYSAILDSTGGRIFGTGADFKSLTANPGVFEGGHGKSVITVDWLGLTTGLRMILQSISIIKLVNTNTNDY